MNQQIYLELNRDRREEAFSFLKSVSDTQAAPPTAEQLKNAFNQLGEWYCAAPPSDARDSRAIQLALFLLRDFITFGFELADAIHADSAERQQTIESIQDGTIQQRAIAELASLKGTGKCA